jgi:hypothetical protein
MEKFDTSQFKYFTDLPFERFNSAKFSIYVLDKKWNYLFINEFVKENLGKRSEGLIGRNMWQVFPELSSDSAFMTLRSNTERNLITNLITTSPITSQRLNITGQVLEDCYLFTSSILPKKDEIMDELRNQLNKRKIVSMQK